MRSSGRSAGRPAASNDARRQGQRPGAAFHAARPANERSKKPRPQPQPAAMRGRNQRSHPRMPRSTTTQSGAMRDRNRVLRARRAQAAAAAQRRRMLKLGGSIAGFIILLVAVVGLVIFSLKKIEEHATPPDPAAAFEPIPCEMDMVAADISHTGSIAGQPVAVNVTVKNARSRVPCVMKTSLQDFKVTITTGDLKVFDSETCEAGIAAPRLLLDKDVASEQTFTWNGQYSGKICSTTGPASPGTYVARAFYQGKELTSKGYVFELGGASAPAKSEPAPEESAPAKEGGAPVSDAQTPPAEGQTSPAEGQAEGEG